jgi:hypothetical protein
LRSRPSDVSPDLTQPVLILKLFQRWVAHVGGEWWPERLQTPTI